MEKHISKSSILRIAKLKLNFEQSFSKGNVIHLGECNFLEDASAIGRLERGIIRRKVRFDGSKN